MERSTSPISQLVRGYQRDEMIGSDAVGLSVPGIPGSEPSASLMSLPLSRCRASPSCQTWNTAIGRGNGGMARLIDIRLSFTYAR